MLQQSPSCFNQAANGRKEGAALRHAHIEIILDGMIWPHLVAWEELSFKAWRILLCKFKMGFWGFLLIKKKKNT